MQEDKPPSTPRSDVSREKSTAVTAKVMTLGARLTPIDEKTLLESDVGADLLNAFQLIDQVPLEVIHAHRNEAVLAFDRLYMVLSSDSVAAHISSVKKPPSGVSDLLRSLTRIRKANYLEMAT